MGNFRIICVLAGVYHGCIDQNGQLNSMEGAPAMEYPTRDEAAAAMEALPTPPEGAYWKVQGNTEAQLEGNDG